jgi:NADP-dependent 3-hydroxy acid dehydrogenase YdfG
MSKTIVVVGFGPAISTAVAERFGVAGFQVALVGRNRDRLDSGVAALRAKGIAAAAFPADAGVPDAIQQAIAAARAQFGPITVIHWNAFGGIEAGDFATAGPAAVRGIFDVAVVGLLAAVQEALPDMRGTKEGAVLITNGRVRGFGFAGRGPRGWQQNHGHRACERGKAQIGRAARRAA